METMEKKELVGELSADEAAMAGAFPEDALSEADAVASLDDDHEDAAAALAKRVPA